MDRTKFEYIRKLWAEETDEWIIRAVTKNKEEYPPEVQAIIMEEAVARKLIKYEVNMDGGNLVASIAPDKKGREIIIEDAQKSYNRKPSIIAKRVLISIPVIIGFSLLAGFLSVFLNLSEKHVGIFAGVPAIIALAIIWGVKDPFGFYEPKKVSNSLSNNSPVQTDVIHNKRCKNSE